MYETNDKVIVNSRGHAHQGKTGIVREVNIIDNYCPYKVEFNNEESGWYHYRELEKVVDNNEDRR